MKQYIAFLRGINVGGHRVKMDRLRELFEEIGLQDVSTFIASGNVIFSAPSADVGALTSKIERHLAAQLGYDVPTFLRTPEELAVITTFEPADLGEGEPPAPSLYVILLGSPPSDELRSTFAGLGSAFDEFQFAQREVYWLIQGKISESPLFGKQLEKAIRGVATTTRNMTTLRRLAAKLTE